MRIGGPKRLVKQVPALHLFFQGPNGKVTVARNDGNNSREISNVERGLRVEKEPGLIVAPIVLHYFAEVADGPGLANHHPGGELAA